MQRTNPLFGRRSRLGHFIARRCLRYLKKFENVEFRLERNGEAWLIERLAALAPRIIFDVGCNRGDWTALAISFHPGAEIHAFDIVPEVAQGARHRFAAQPTIVVNDFGLGATSEQATIYYDPRKTTVSSLYRSSDGGPIEKREGRILAAASYLDDRGIDHVDLLKIDVEGAEHLVLGGFEDMLRTQQVRLVQFEYGKNSIQTKFLLRDYYALFEKLNYRVGKLYRKGVGFKPYEQEDENFWGPNYIAIAESDQELFELLAIRGFRSLYRGGRKNRS